MVETANRSRVLASIFAQLVSIGARDFFESPEPRRYSAQELASMLGLPISAVSGALRGPAAADLFLMSHGGRVSVNWERVGMGELAWAFDLPPSTLEAVINAASIMAYVMSEEADLRAYDESLHGFEEDEAPSFRSARSDVQ